MLTGIFPEDISLPDLLGSHLDKTTELLARPRVSRVFSEIRSLTLER